MSDRDRQMQELVDSLDLGELYDLVEYATSRAFDLGEELGR